MEITKKVKLSFVGKDGNAFNLMGMFIRQAQKEKWTQEEIDTVMNEAKRKDYNYLLATLLTYSEEDQKEIENFD